MKDTGITTYQIGHLTVGFRQLGVQSCAVTADVGVGVGVVGVGVVVVLGAAVAAVEGSNLSPQGGWVGAAIDKY